MAAKKKSSSASKKGGASKKGRGKVEKVMHEFKEGELATSTGKKVKSRDQAIAIGLREAGASNTQSPKEKKSALRHTERAIRMD